MRLRRISIENVRSFLDRVDLTFEADIAVLIGPNGGGKTNLLDTVTTTIRAYLLKPFSLPLEGSPPSPTLRAAEDFPAEAFEKHELGSALPSTVTIEVEVTARDVEIVAELYDLTDELSDYIKTEGLKGFASKPLSNFDHKLIKVGDTHTYTIVNRDVQGNLAPEAAAYLSFLQQFEALRLLKARYDNLPLSVPFMYFPVNRAIGDIPSAIRVADFNEADHKRSVDRGWSRSTAPTHALAIGRIFQQYRRSIEPETSEFYSPFDSDGSLNSMSETLKGLGYDWNIKTKAIDGNEYELILKRSGVSYNLSRASSGEKELLTYVLTIYALGIRDALIIVDEPELHLHPRWQGALLSLFEELAADTGNQFVFATHSPSFISPTSIGYVTRVYSDGKQSHADRLAEAELPDRKHLLSIVNSQNNSKIFFADLVVLVEGISDRILFERLITDRVGDNPSHPLIEIVSVGGKTIFKQYAKLLAACKIQYIIIADLDYITEVGGELKGLFSTNVSKVKEAIEDSPASHDGAAIVAAIEDALSTGNAEVLRPIYEYVSGRKRRLREDLSEEELAKLDAFIATRADSGEFILSRGDLEKYLPVGHSDKNLEKLIALLENPNFRDDLPQAQLAELDTIVDRIVSKVLPA
jgi:putative ATP-dependent endonuclease of the OLD family